MGLIDKIKGMISGGAGDVASLKEQASGIKQKADGMVAAYGDKLPDSVRDGYENVSDKLDTVLPGGIAESAEGAGEVLGTAGSGVGIETTGDDIAAQ